MPLPGNHLYAAPLPDFRFPIDIPENASIRRQLEFKFFLQMVNSHFLFALLNGERTPVRIPTAESLQNPGGNPQQLLCSLMYEVPYGITFFPILQFKSPDGQYRIIKITPWADFVLLPVILHFTLMAMNNPVPFLREHISPFRHGSAHDSVISALFSESSVKMLQNFFAENKFIRNSALLPVLLFGYPWHTAGTGIILLRHIQNILPFQHFLQSRSHIGMRSRHGPEQCHSKGKRIGIERVPSPLYHFRSAESRCTPSPFPACVFDKIQIIHVDKPDIGPSLYFGHEHVFV